MKFNKLVSRLVLVLFLFSCVSTVYPKDMSQQLLPNIQQQQSSNTQTQPGFNPQEAAFRWMQYNSEKKSSTTPFLINAILYPGLGNMFVGGYVKGTLLLGTYIYFSAPLLDPNSTDAEISTALTGTLAVWVIGMITAFTDTSAYNKKLQRKYGLIANIKVPVDNPGIMIALEKRF